MSPYECIRNKVLLCTRDLQGNREKTNKCYSFCSCCVVFSFILSCAAVFSVPCRCLDCYDFRACLFHHFSTMTYYYNLSIRGCFIVIVIIINFLFSFSIFTMSMCRITLSPSRLCTTMLPMLALWCSFVATLIDSNFFLSFFFSFKQHSALQHNLTSLLIAPVAQCLICLSL